MEYLVKLKKNWWNKETKEEWKKNGKGPIFIFFEFWENVQLSTRSFSRTTSNAAILLERMCYFQLLWWVIFLTVMLTVMFCKQRVGMKTNMTTRKQVYSKN